MLGAMKANRHRPGRQEDHCHRPGGTELGRMRDMDRVPLRPSTPYMADKERWSVDCNIALDRTKNSFWHMWHVFGSRATVHYGNLQDLLSTDERFDIVLAGAIIEHLADPITLIGACCRVAREKVIIAFTPVVNAQEPFMRPAISWTVPEQRLCLGGVILRTVRQDIPEHGV